MSDDTPLPAMAHKLSTQAARLDALEGWREIVDDWCERVDRTLEDANLTLGEPAPEVIPGPPAPPPAPEKPTITGPDAARVGEPYTIKLSHLPEGVGSWYAHFDDGKKAGHFVKGDLTVTHVFTEAHKQRVIRCHYTDPATDKQVPLNRLRIEVLGEAAEESGPEAPPADAPGADASRPRLWGVNLSLPRRYSGNWALGNVAKLADETTKRRFSDEEQMRLSREPLTLRPGEDLMAVADNGGLTPGGRWTVEWDGPGEARLHARLYGETGYATLIEAGEGWATYELRGGANYLFVACKEDEIFNVRLWHDESNPDHLQVNPAAIGTIRGAHTLRMMDWGWTNGGRVEEWSDRSLPGGAMIRAGVPLETQLEAVQAIGAKVWWLCIPPRASMDYSRELGLWLAEHVPDEVEVRVEYANEAWNWFGVFNEFHNWLRATPDLPDLSKPGELTDHFARKYGHRAALHLEQVREGFPRAKFVCGAQVANPWIGREAMRYAIHAGQRPDYLGVTGYFQNGWGHRLAAGEISLDEFFAGLAETLRGEGPWRRIKEAKRDAEAVGAEVIMYEGGTHLQAIQLPEAEREAGVARLAEAHRDPRMREIARINAERWYEATGNAEYMAFGDVGRDGPWGFWGFGATQLAADGSVIDLRQDPRFAGVLDAAGETPKPREVLRYQAEQRAEAAQ